MFFLPTSLLILLIMKVLIFVGKDSSKITTVLLFLNVQGRSSSLSDWNLKLNSHDYFLFLLFKSNFFRLSFIRNHYVDPHLTQPLLTSLL